jgi:transposase, IS5 family
MSLCHEGLATKSKTISVTTDVQASDPLICLANAIDWQDLSELALPDLKKTRLGFWRLGRRLYLRIHLAVMILQALRKESDRGIEDAITSTPLYQVFCGLGIVARWHCPDHTKIEEFRNRLLPATHKAIGDYVLQLATSLGFADPSWMDLDSTVQEANIAYPSDASLMLKLSKKSRKVWDCLVASGKRGMKKLAPDLAAITKASKEYFFLAKNAAIEKRRAVFQTYHRLVKGELQRMIRYCEGLTESDLVKLPWHIREASQQIAKHGWRLLLDIAHFIRTNRMKKGKILSLHALAAVCIRKGKVGKENEFGRVFQLGRIGGNFIVPFTCTSLRMEDKKSLTAAVCEHASLFGEGRLESIATDKGYYSKANVSFCQKRGVNTDGLARPGNLKTDKVEPELALPLRNRRAGVEPLIGHVKDFGLRKSRMRSDQATLSSGYRCVSGFNLHQMLRHMKEKAA